MLVGHAIKNDLSALMLKHPHNLIRDTSRFKPLCVSKDDKGTGVSDLVPERWCLRNSIFIVYIISISVLDQES